MEDPKKLADRLLLDLPEGRYDIVKIAHDWVEIFGKSDDAKGLSSSELVKQALDDIISGRVTPKDVKNAKAKGAAPAAEVSEEKEEKAAPKAEKAVKAEKPKKEKDEKSKK